MMMTWLITMTQIDVQECKSSFPKQFKPDDYIVQRKYDGTRLIFQREGGEATLYGKSWKTNYATSYPDIFNALSTISGDVCLEGELVFYNDISDTEIFYTAGAVYKTSGLTPHLKVFDIHHMYNVDYYLLPQVDRSNFIIEKFRDFSPHISPVLWYTGRFGPELFKQTLSVGGEGIIYKKRNEPYAYGTRRNWIKQKDIQTADCVIMGITNGTGRRQGTFGSLILGQYIDGKLCHVCNASGFDTTMQLALYMEIDRQPDVLYRSMKLKNVQKLIAPTMVVEVEYMERTENNNLRHPRFIRLRDDKRAQECTYGEETSSQVSLQGTLDKWCRSD